ncbi:MAG: phosphoribosylformylglycinamidine cyclo-ligase [Elusimicrobiota bacterium]
MAKKKKVTYKGAGVDIDAGDLLVDKIVSAAKNLKSKSMLGGIGGFGGAYLLDKKYKNPVLISGTDGVGTKLKIAFLLNKHNTVGIDLVAMCVNDIITCGAEPLFFLDYFATGKLSVNQGEQIIKGIVEGCRQSGCMLLGGETAEMPSFYKKGEYDLAGFAVGVVEKNKMINGSGIRPGDVVLGIPSSGVHSNGFSLVRKALNNRELKKYGAQLITPTRIYVKEIMPLLKKNLVKGLAHITGGGLPGNVPRVLPKNCNVKIYKNSWNVPKIFKTIKEYGNVDENEMFKVFNMGIGMTVIVSKNDSAKVKKIVKDAIVIGEVVSGKNRVVLI